jgi:lipopolysaccharide assembly protein A
MRIVGTIFWVLVLLVLTFFALKNSDPITLKGFFGYVWNAPLVLVLLVFFASGVVLGLLASVGTVFRLKREVSKLKTEIKKRTVAEPTSVSSPEAAAAAAPPAPLVPTQLP